MSKSGRVSKAQQPGIVVQYAQLSIFNITGSVTSFVLPHPVGFCVAMYRAGPLLHWILALCYTFWLCLVSILVLLGLEQLTAIYLSIPGLVMSVKDANLFSGISHSTLCWLDICIRLI
mmetsp:Transcript_9760/g.17203  ORF Transcript_9760/g.17203 Transcript_9760/m.17203 type:complete len:118 (-) Transcript_9760:111-464(-)